MGIDTPLKPYPSIALGAQNVTPLEMASAYGTLATGGRHYEPVFITKVVDRNKKVLREAEPKGKQVVKASVAYAANKILKGVITSGTARRAFIGRPAAGKTGTSQDHRDVWFVGYTPQLVTAVWVGHRKEQPIYVNGSRAFGGTVCAPIWADFMRNALAGKKVMDFKPAPSPRYNPAKFKIPHGTVEETKTAEPRKVTPKPATPKPGGVKPGSGTKPPPPPPPPPDPEPTGTPTP
jgi:penicillin-binding protein 1A